jgi:hypothetical protein
MTVLSLRALFFLVSLEALFLLSLESLFLINIKKGNLRLSLTFNFIIALLIFKS